VPAFLPPVADPGCFHPIKDHSSLNFTPISLFPGAFQQPIVRVGVGFDEFHESFHLAQHQFPDLFGILLFPGMGHLNTQLVHGSDEMLRVLDSVTEPVGTDQHDCLDECPRGIPE